MEEQKLLTKQNLHELAMYIKNIVDTTQTKFIYDVMNSPVVYHNIDKHSQTRVIVQELSQNQEIVLGIYEIELNLEKSLMSILREIDGLRDWMK